MNKSTTYAAIDLGSNSFHMIIAREENGHLHILDKMRESVRLALGLNEEGDISGQTETLALETLSYFGQRISAFASSKVRCVGTNTLRKVSQNSQFLTKAEAALGHPIEIIAGREEARLIYLGTTHSSAPTDGNQLVIDIGGGSTELILGANGTPHTLESVAMGCVTFTQSFFEGGKISAKSYHQAVLAAQVALEPVLKRYIDSGFSHVLGCSGTIRAVEFIAQHNGWLPSGINAAAISHIREALLSAKHIDQVELEGLNDNRQPVILGGLAVLEGLFKSLKIDFMEVSQSALREGLLYDTIGRKKKKDVRKKTIKQMMRYYQIDREHAWRMQACAEFFYNQVQEAWQLKKAHRKQLKWAIALSESGLVISHAKFHHHSEYIVRHADMPGFSWNEQSILATLVRLQRNSFNQTTLAMLPPQFIGTVGKMAILMRLCRMMHRSRQLHELPQITLSASGNTLTITANGEWLQAHSLIQVQLQQEVELHQTQATAYNLILKII